MLKQEAYQVIDAEEDQDAVTRFGIMQAPTLVVMKGDDVTKYVNASNIKRFADSRRRAVNA